MKRFLFIVTAFALMTISTDTRAAHIQAAGTPDTFVANWDAVASRAFAASSLSPAEGMTIFAYLGIAEYDSVVAVKGGYEPFMVEVHAPHASAEAAVAAAAHTILAKYLPEQEASITGPAYSASVATIADGDAKTAGTQLGEFVANTIIAERASDGFRAQMTYRAPSPPIAGAWIPTAPTPPIGPYLGLMRPFSLASADQFRPPPPPALDSIRWVTDYNETKTLGARGGVFRTSDQSLAAQFWAEAPIQQAQGAFRKFILDHNLDILDAARLMAMLTVTRGDAMIACFDAKYKYAAWRPITAIPAGNADGNEVTVGDATWLPFLAGTPNHPEYPSAHSCVTPSAGLVIAKFLGTDNIHMTIPSLTSLGDRYYATRQDLAVEVGEARIWGGIHFRSAIEQGTDIGYKTAEQVLSRHFRKVGN